jgi:hypothetical protein
MALELAKHNSVYEDIASKFFEASPFFLLPYMYRLTLYHSISSSLRML